MKSTLLIGRQVNTDSNQQTTRESKEKTRMTKWFVAFALLQDKSFKRGNTNFAFCLLKCSNKIIGSNWLNKIIADSGG